MVARGADFEDFRSVPSPALSSVSSSVRRMKRDVLWSHPQFCDMVADGARTQDHRKDRTIDMWSASPSTYGTPKGHRIFQPVGVDVR
jgi:hypothetical protein